MGFIELEVVVVLHPSEVLKHREVSQGAPCHRSSPSSPPTSLCLSWPWPHPRATYTLPVPSHLPSPALHLHPSLIPQLTPTMPVPGRRRDLPSALWSSHLQPHLSPVTPSMGSCHPAALARLTAASAIRQTGSSRRILDRLVLFFFISFQETRC